MFVYTKNKLLKDNKMKHLKKIAKYYNYLQNIV